MTISSNIYELQKCTWNHATSQTEVNNAINKYVQIGNNAVTEEQRKQEKKHTKVIKKKFCMLRMNSQKTQQMTPQNWREPKRSEKQQIF